MFYRSPKEQDSLSEISKLFYELSSSEKIIGTINEKGITGVSHDKLIHINNHLSSSNCWSNVQDWTVYVKYTIKHPDGDVFISDNISNTESNISREDEVLNYDAYFSGGILKLYRLCSNKPPKGRFNTKKYTNVRVSRVKTFSYCTERSSFLFKLEIVWNGKSKEDASSSEPRFIFSLETDDYIKSSKNSMYSAVSFIEKCLDIVSLGTNLRQTLDNIS